MNLTFHTRWGRNKLSGPKLLILEQAWPKTDLEPSGPVRPPLERNFLIWWEELKARRKENLIERLSLGCRDKFVFTLVLRFYHFLNQSEVKPKPIGTCSRAGNLLRVLFGQIVCSASWWLARVNTSVLFGVTSINWKLLLSDAVLRSLSRKYEFKGETNAFYLNAKPVDAKMKKTIGISKSLSMEQGSKTLMIRNSPVFC